MPGGGAVPSTTAHPPEPRFIGTYRQLFTNAGRQAGPDTHLTRSIPGSYSTNGDEGNAAYSDTSMSVDATTNRCVLIRPGWNTVQAFAYDATGAVRQQAQLRRYHARLTGDVSLPTNDFAVATWSTRADLLLDEHPTNDVARASLSVLSFR